MSHEGSTSLPTTIKIKAKGTPRQSVAADICVVGAGISGVSAAIEAARLGRKVVLVDGLPSLGRSSGQLHYRHDLRPILERARRTPVDPRNRRRHPS